LFAEVELIIFFVLETFENMQIELVQRDIMDGLFVKNEVS